MTKTPTLISQSHKMQIQMRSYYHDRVDTDADNRSFFIYDLFCYNNRNYYAYGETNDIASTEFMLKRYVPIYQLVYNHPVADNHANVATFEEFIAPYKQKHVILMDRISTFVLDDDISIESVEDKLSELFSSHV